MSDLENALDNFVTAALAVDGISAAYKFEPGRLDVLPAVSLVFIGGPQAPSSTSGWSQINWSFRCALTVPSSDLNSAQSLLFDLIPKLYVITRSDPDLGGTCDWSDLNDTNEEPPFMIEDLRGARKHLTLTITTTEQ